MKLFIGCLVAFLVACVAAYALFNVDKKTERDLEGEDTQWHG